MTKFILLLMAVLVSSPTGLAAGPVASPGCDDNDPGTNCCPLEDRDYALSPDDWWACFDGFVDGPPRVVA